MQLLLAAMYADMPVCVMSMRAGLLAVHHLTLSLAALV